MDDTDDGIGGTGYSLEDLSAYLDSGRTPPIAEIDTNAECQAVLASMERLGGLSRDLVAVESRQPLDDGWYDGLMREVMREFRAGRDIPLFPASPNAELVVTEGALHELIRAAGDTVPGILLGRTRLHRAESEGPFDIEVTVSAGFGTRLADAAGQVRTAIAEAVERQGELRVGRIDVTVTDVHVDDEEERS
jgi:uncharacterized alkaline shock family protein YloU